VVVFPNTAWNHTASLILWMSSIALVFATFIFCSLIAIRLASKLLKTLLRRHADKTKQSGTYRGRTWRRTLVFWLFSVVVFLVLLVAFVEYEIRSSQVYQASVAEARVSAEVKEILGQPIDGGWFNSGEISQSSNGTGHASLTIPLSGPKGKGVLKVEAGRQSGRWRFSMLQFSTGNAPGVDLLRDQHRN